MTPILEMKGQCVVFLILSFIMKRSVKANEKKMKNCLLKTAHKNYVRARWKKFLLVGDDSGSLMGTVYCGSMPASLG